MLSDLISAAFRTAVECKQLTPDPLNHTGMTSRISPTPSINSSAALLLLSVCSILERSLQKHQDPLKPPGRFQSGDNRFIPTFFLGMFSLGGAIRSTACIEGCLKSGRVKTIRTTHTIKPGHLPRYTPSLKYSQHKQIFRFHSSSQCCDSCSRFPGGGGSSGHQRSWSMKLSPSRLPSSTSLERKFAACQTKLKSACVLKERRGREAGKLHLTALDNRGCSRKCTSIN